MTPVVKRASLAILVVASVTAAVSGTAIALTTAWEQPLVTPSFPPPPLGMALPTPMPTPASLAPGVTDIILLGIDRRRPDEGWRTDTMILVSVDPQGKIASMVSIPRDLYVSIPGYGKTRLNLADNIGFEQGYPGGGPALLRATLEENLGITFDHYIRIDFQGFMEVIDALGGVDVDVRCPTELWVPDMKSPGDYELFRTIPAGMRHMDGALALIYCRCRVHSELFDRDRRQREMLLAIRNRVLELGVSGLLPRLFHLLDSMQDHVQTDLEPAQMVALAKLLSEIPPHNVSQRAIDLSMAPEWITPEGSWMMVPDRERIKEFVAGRMIPPTWEERSLVEEGVRIAIDDGTTIEGFAAQVADRLKSRGYRVVEVGKAHRLDHTETIIISHTGASLTLDRLRQYFRVREENVLYEPDWLSPVGIRVILGTDAQPPCR